MNSNKEYAQQMREGAVIVNGVVQVSTDLWEYTANIIENSVRVIRCKDCIYHNVSPCPMRLSLNWTNGNDFCSYGERRSDE
jgi:hypothetical protein